MWISSLDAKFRFQVWMLGLDLRFGSQLGELAGRSGGTGGRKAGGTESSGSHFTALKAMYEKPSR